MKRVITLILGLMLVFSFVACSSNNGNADNGSDGIIEDAGNAVNDVLDGAENVVDDVTGSDSANNNMGTTDNNMGTNNNTSTNTNK